MADYTNISNATFAKGKPFSFRAARWLRDNIIAIAEGAVGAPRIRPGAIGGFMPGDYEVHNNAAAVYMTNPDSTGNQIWKRTLVPYDGVYRVVFNYGVSVGYGANVRLFVDGVPQSDNYPIQNSGTITVNDVTVLAGQEVQIGGNGGSSPGESGAQVSSLRLFADSSLNYVSVA